MAYITEFSVDGLAGREGPYTQKLNRDINVFFGLNGSGKTTLLKILHSAFAKDTSILDSISFKTATVTLYSTAYRGSFTLNVTKNPEYPQEPTAEAFVSSPDLFGDEVAVEPIWTERPPRARARRRRLRWQITPTESEVGEVENITWSHQYLPTARLYWAIPGSDGAASGRSEEELDKYYSTIMQRVWRDYTDDVNRSVRKIQDGGFRQIIRNLLAAVREPAKTDEPFAAHDTYQRVSRFLERQQTAPENILGPEDEFVSRYNEDSRVRAGVRVIESVEREIAEASKPQEKLRDLIQQMFTGNKVVEFGEKEISVATKDKGNIDLPFLSSGEKHLLLICIQALMARQDSFIIDEPELSMHIDWQHRLLGALRQLNPRMQLIAATHSPEIMAELPDDKIFRL